MKILVVSRALPRPTWGTGIRSYHLLRALAQKHDVTLLAFVDESDMEASAADHLSPFVRQIRRIELPPTSAKRWTQIRTLAMGKSYYMAAHSVPAGQPTIDEELAENQYDAIFFSELFIADYRLPPQIKIILDEHNIEHELMWRSYQSANGIARRGFNWIEYRRIKPLELALCRRSDLVLLTSEREREVLQPLLPSTNLRVVPNGVDIQTYTNDDSVAEIPGRVIFTAAFNYYPNVQGAMHFAERCWPLIRQARPDATWYLVGRNPPPEIVQLGTLPGVTVTGTVPEVQPYLAEAQVAIVPLLTGAGTRLKILEAMAMRRAVVSTALGCEGIDCEPNVHLLVEDEPTKFADMVLTLLNNSPRRAAFGEAGRTLVEERYSWEYCGNQLLSAIDEAVEKGWPR